MARLVTRLPLSERQIEALLDARVDTVEAALALGPLGVTQRLLVGKPVLSAREIDGALKVLFDL